MNILDEIITHKKKQVEEQKKSRPVRTLEQSSFFARPVISMRQHLILPGKSGVIAEIKRKSPSKGIINPLVTIEGVAAGYVTAGASGLSILTDEKYFGGFNEDIVSVRDLVPCPILRKDFTVDEYQLVEAKSIGADAILLIAAALTPTEIKFLTKAAHLLHLEVLMEVHNEEELRANLDADVDMVGVNNRDLKTFDVKLETSKRLAPAIPQGIIKVAESGIESPADVQGLKKYGFKGFLIGQSFMQTSDPGAAAASFIRELKTLETK